MSSVDAATATHGRKRICNYWFYSHNRYFLFLMLICGVFVVSILRVTRWTDDIYTTTATALIPESTVAVLTISNNGRDLSTQTSLQQYVANATTDIVGGSKQSVNSNAAIPLQSPDVVNIHNTKTPAALSKIQNSVSVVYADAPVASIIMSETSASRARRPFCLSWSINSDTWWTHHVDWEVSYENNTHYCFKPMPKHSIKTALFRQVYANQYYNAKSSADTTKEAFCSRIKTVQMWSSGWGADFKNVVNSLDKAVGEKRPMRMFVDVHSDNPFKRGWHYAALKNASRPVCPLNSMECYFLNLTDCATNASDLDGGSVDRKLHVKHISWLYEYVTRPQTWLRKRVYDYYQANFASVMQTPCTALHVRRTDVVLHNRFSRRYHPIEEYMDTSLYDLDRNLLLLTDDANAIEEALYKYNNRSMYNWMYERRTRHRGAEGGWENQIPSGDPLHETVVILATIRAVSQCHTLVYSTSNLAEIFQAVVKQRHGKDAKLYNIDEGKDVFNASFAETRVVSKSYLNQPGRTKLKVPK